MTSDKCYENREWVWPYREDDRLGGHDPYSASKACAELVTSCYRQALARDRTIRISSVRAGNVIGGGDWARDRLMPDLVTALAAKKPAIIRNPASIRPWQHVVEPLRGYLLVAQRLSAERPDDGTAWNFGPNPESMQSVSAVADAVCRLWGEGSAWQCDSSAQPHEARTLTLDSAKARAHLGWSPRLDHQTALAWTVAWYKAVSAGADPREETIAADPSLQGAFIVKCRSCGAPLSRTFVDLGMQPLSNAYVDPSAEHAMEPFYPLHVYVCDSCLLVQLPESATPERLFSDYSYLSSMSESWLAHCKRYASAMVERCGLSASSLVVEVASNDGYLLRFFRALGIPVLGIEPAANIAAMANAAGIPSLPRFFGSELAQDLVAAGKRADLLVGNNVLAHVPNLNDFVSGLSALLAPSGVLTLEFPHLGRLLAETSSTRYITSTSRTSRWPQQSAYSKPTGCSYSTSRSFRRTADPFAFSRDMRQRVAR